MICPFQRPERQPPVQEGWEAWTCELLIGARVFDLFCAARLHAMQIGNRPIMLTDQKGLLPLRQPIRITLGAPTLDVSEPESLGDNPPFIVLQFPRQRKVWPPEPRRRSPRVVVIK